MKPSEQTTYIFSEGELATPIDLDASFYVKIGITTRTPESRLGGCQTGNPRPLRLLRSYEGDYELALHNKLGEFRQMGEWFLLPGKILRPFTYKGIATGDDLLRELGKWEYGIDRWKHLGETHAERRRRLGRARAVGIERIEGRVAELRSARKRLAEQEGDALRTLRRTRRRVAAVAAEIRLLDDAAVAVVDGRLDALRSSPYAHRLLIDDLLDLRAALRGDVRGQIREILLRPVGDADLASAIGEISESRGDGRGYERHLEIEELDALAAGAAAA